MTFEGKYDVAVFCAAAAMAALPPPTQGEGADTADLMTFIKHWMEQAITEGAAKGLQSEQVLEDTNEGSRGINAAFTSRSAPFYDLTVCDTSEPSTLWQRVPATIDTAKPYLPRNGNITLDRLADDLEVEYFQSMTGRLRPAFARIQAQTAFALDVRILALKYALALPSAQGDENVLGRRSKLGVAYFGRQIGARYRNIENAINAYKAAIAVLDSSTADWAFVQSDLGFAYFVRPLGDRSENVERAIEAYQAALPVLMNTRSLGGWATTQQRLAGAYSDRMRGDRASNMEMTIAADLASLSFRSKDEDPAGWAATQVNLASHYLARMQGGKASNIEAAITAFESALTVITKDKSPDAWVILQNDLAAAYADRLRGDQASNQEKAIGILQEVRSLAGQNSAVRTTASFELGEVYSRRVQGQPHENLSQAVTFYEEALLGSNGSERWPIVVGRQLGAALIGLGRYEEASPPLLIASRAAEGLIGLGVNEAQARDVLSDARDIYPLAAFAAAKNGDAKRALAILSAGKARLLSSALSVRTLELTTAEKDQLERLRAEIQRQESLLERNVRSTGVAGPAEAAPLDSLLALRAQAIALYEKGARHALSEPSSAEVISTGALVAPVITEFGSEILVATKGGKVVAFDAPDVTRDKLQFIAKGAKDAVALGGWLGEYKRGAIDDGLAQVRPALGAALGAGIRGALNAANVKPGSRIIIMPDGASALLPLALASDARSGHTLLEDYEVSFTPSLAALAASQSRIAKGGDASLALLGPSTGAALKYAPLEAALVAATFAAPRRLVMEGPSLDALLKGLATKSYWHFATHGTFNWAEPRRSGVEINSDVLLTLGDLLEARESLGVPRLVVLSACETGISDVERNPDEFTGLPVGFIQAGAAGVVASLWPVNDLSTTLLMGKFYDLHLRAHERPAQALRGAQLWLRDAKTHELLAYVEGKRAGHALSEEQAGAISSQLRAISQDKDPSAKPFSAPSFWGAFVLYGE